MSRGTGSRSRLSEQTLRRGMATVGRVGQHWILAVLGVIAWEIAARNGGSIFFPPPTRIAVSFSTTVLGGPATQLFLSDAAMANVLPSVGRLIGAWAAAAVLGVAVGIALGRSRVALDYFAPLLAFCRALPPPVLVPVFIVLFDLGAQMQMATIAFGAVWPILLNTIDGASSLHSTQRDTAAAFLITRPQWIVRVVLPAAAPKIFAGLRVSLSIAVILMVISELMGSTNGIGYQLSQARTTFDYPMMWSIIVLLGLLGYLLNVALLAIQRVALARHPTSP